MVASEVSWFNISCFNNRIIRKTQMEQYTILLILSMRNTVMRLRCLTCLCLNPERQETPSSLTSNRPTETVLVWVVVLSLSVGMLALTPPSQNPSTHAGGPYTSAHSHQGSVRFCVSHCSLLFSYLQLTVAKLASCPQKERGTT